jgi:hypothetical protein
MIPEIKPPPPTKPSLKVKNSDSWLAGKISHNVLRRLK